VIKIPIILTPLLNSGIELNRLSLICDSWTMQVVVTLAVAAVLMRVKAITHDERRAFLSQHNLWRSRVQPPAGDMLKMVCSVVY